MIPEILYSRKESHGKTWAEITLNRPEKGNALTRPMLDELGRIVDEIAADSAVRAVVLRANGRFFCTGGDIAEWGSLSPDDMAQKWILPGIEVFERIAQLPQPVIALLQGHTLGGGLELALTADFRIAAAPAKFGTPEVTLGMIAGWHGIRSLAELIGVGRARQMTLTGSLVTASDALAWGLVTDVAETTEGLDEHLEILLATLLTNAPIAMAVTKSVLSSMHADLRHLHASSVARVAGTEDCKEGVLAFLEKRKPSFQNH
ncbi:MAG TPA: enoyl-CoA hydratase/isomerase family protein [Acidisarcina sp.]|nr:enoyl-CoA hydratase/isomerase family protein [Acidisarcina sp.]